jgi:hypothetical protein
MPPPAPRNGARLHALLQRNALLHAHARHAQPPHGRVAACARAS